MNFALAVIGTLATAYAVGAGMSAKTDLVAVCWFVLAAIAAVVAMSAWTSLA